MRLPDPHRSNAVLIGVANYRHLPRLPAVANNITGLAKLLTDPKGCGLPAARCVRLPDVADPTTLYNALRRARDEAEDTLIVYFAGHGHLDSRNDLYLAVADTETDSLPASALRFDAVRELLRDSRAANRILILDCCYSGRAIQDMSGSGIDPVLDVQGTYTLTATSGNMIATAPVGERYTSFTGELISLLTTGLPNGPELLTFEVLFPWLRHNLKKRDRPAPKQRGVDYTAARLALSRNRAYRRPAQPTKPEPASVQTAPAPPPAPDLPPPAPQPDPAYHRPVQSLSLLTAHLRAGEFAQADLLTTDMLLEQAEQRETGWIPIKVGAKVPLELLYDIDTRWATHSGRRQGFLAQRSLAWPRDRTHAQFFALSAAFGWDDKDPRSWKPDGWESIPKGFYPTLYNPRNDHLPEWYDHRMFTVLAVHLRLRDWNGA